MLGRLRPLIELGVHDDLPDAEARRVQTINVVALFAFFLTAFFSAIFLISIDIADSLPILVANAVFLLGYAATLNETRRGHADRAVWLVLLTGLMNIATVAFMVGFTAGPSVYFFVLAIGGVLITRIDDTMTRWFALVVAVVGYTVIALFDPPSPSSISGTLVESFLQISQFASVVVFGAGVALYQRRRALAAEAALADANQRSEQLLLNILPREIAERLEDGETEIADRADEVTVLFADLVGSTPLSERLSPQQLVAYLNEIFTAFDGLADDLRLEKIKTIGDAYMVVAGLPNPRPDHVQAIAEMALAMREDLASHSLRGFAPPQMRFGIATGPVVAGVIGKRKFSYDLWGDTVNTASRMESQGVAGQIQVTETVYEALADYYEFQGPTTVDIKGKGDFTTYFLKQAKGDDRPGPSKYPTKTKT